MLEIIFVITLWKKMGEMMLYKGYRKPFWFQFFVPVGWFGGEFLGALFYGVIRVIRGSQETALDLNAYLCALVGAGLGIGCVFLVASLFSSYGQVPPPLPPQSPRPLPPPMPVPMVRATPTPFKFSCPHCGQHISVTTDDIGTGGSCPGCNQGLTVPAPGG